MERLIMMVVNIFSPKRIYQLNDGWKAEVEGGEKLNTCCFVFINDESYDQIAHLQSCVFILRDQLKERIKFDPKFEFIHLSVGYHDNENRTGTKAIFTFEQKKRKRQLVGLHNCYHIFDGSFF